MTDAEKIAIREALKTTHATYALADFTRFRLTYKGGRDFLNAYLIQHTREDDADFFKRKCISYNPAFAKSAIQDLVKGLQQRAVEIHREGGHELYQSQILGQLGGVDQDNSSMNGFIAKVLDEFFSIGRVGIFCDRAYIGGLSKVEADKRLPYYYIYRAEDILNWQYDQNALTQAKTLAAVLLRHDFQTTNALGFVASTKVGYRYLHYTPDYVIENPFDPTAPLQSLGPRVIDSYYTEDGELRYENVLELPEIPFTMLDLGQSPMQDVADYQIALLNLSSSDLYYAWQANVPFYTEQMDNRGHGMFNNTRRPVEDLKPEENQETAIDYIKQMGLWKDGRIPSHADAANPDHQHSEVVFGPLTGRRYPQGAERPGFINPSTEPLMASMQKEAQIKQEIRELLRVSITRLAQNGGEQQLDERGLEAGLSYLALSVERAEMSMARYWHNYMRDTNFPQITYPQTYDLRTDEERREEADKLAKLAFAVPSAAFRKEVAREIARTLFGGGRLSKELLDLISKEIDANEFPTSDPDIIQQDHENGFVSTATASKARGYKEEEAALAAKDHADRLARIQEAQAPVEGDGAARGVGDTAPIGGRKVGRAEKRDKRKRGDDRRTSPQTRIEED